MQTVPNAQTRLADLNWPEGQSRTTSRSRVQETGEQEVTGQDDKKPALAS